MSEIQEALTRWRDGGPALFAREALGATPTPQQDEASEALVKRRRVAIRSGHGTGKTTFEAWSILWFLATHFPAKVPATAPTSHQLDDVLWAELAKWHRVLSERLPPLGREFDLRAGAFSLRAAPQESFAVARTSRPEQPEALQGFHSDNILFVIDEASGIPDIVFEVAESALASAGAYVLMAANPTRMEGYFYRAHHEDRARWAALHWDGRDSPLVSRDYIAEMAEKYGIESAIYAIRVLGDFAGNPDGVIPLHLIESAIDREVREFGPVRWGVDVARFGSDRTALAKRRSNWLLEPIKHWTGKDTMQVAGLVKAEFDATKTALRPEAICIDVIGLGAGVVDRCRELGLPVQAVNVAETPAVREQYVRLRDELWFEAREWFYARDCRIPKDDDLIADLTMPSFKVLSSGKKLVEDKDQLKKRGMRSPDLADAFCLTFAKGSGQRSVPIKYPNMHYA